MKLKTWVQCWANWSLYMIYCEMRSCQNDATEITSYHYIFSKNIQIERCLRLNVLLYSHKFDCGIIKLVSPPSFVQIRSLQYVLNFAAFILTRISPHRLIIPIWLKLHWLPVQSRFEYKILTLTYKAVSGSVPRYLCDLIQACTASRPLCSGSLPFLQQPRSNLKTMNNRGPRLRGMLHMKRSGLSSVFTALRNVL